jgi:alginate O-acetyltransferase complex protein AlgI
LQGGGVAGNRLYQIAMMRRLTTAGYGRLCANPMYRTVSRGLTFTWFAFTLLWFWASWSRIGALAAVLGKVGSVIAILGTICSASFVLEPYSFRLKHIPSCGGSWRIPWR